MMSSSQGGAPQPAQGIWPAMTSSVGVVGAPPDQRWGCVQLGELTLFLLPSQPSWPTRKEEKVPSLPTPGAQVDPRSWVQKVTEPGVTPEDALCIFGFLPLAQNHDEPTTTKSILPSVRQPEAGPKALPPEKDLLVLPAEAPGRPRNCQSLPSEQGARRAVWTRGRWGKCRGFTGSQ